MRGYAHVIKEDPVNRSLLFLGTEFGLWVSLDGGRQWAQFKGGDFPSVAVRDCRSSRATTTSCIATHGRGIWIIDDITPLRALTPATLRQGRRVPADASRRSSACPRSGGWVERRRGVRRAEPARRRASSPTTSGRATSSATQARGARPRRQARRHAARRASGAGSTASTWSMRLKPPRVPPAAQRAPAAPSGPRVLPGTYTVKLTQGQRRSTPRSSPVVARSAREAHGATTAGRSSTWP